MGVPFTPPPEGRCPYNPICVWKWLGEDAANPACTPAAATVDTAQLYDSVRRISGLLRQLSDDTKTFTVDELARMLRRTSSHLVDVIHNLEASRAA